jgi:DNA polymerase III subunit epsilon
VTPCHSPQQPAGSPETVFAVVDLETSGLDPRRHRILQVAVVTTRFDGTVVDTWSSRVRPGLRRVGARRVHGLSRRSLRGAPRSEAVLAEVARRVEGLVTVAHNAPFDLAFLQQAYRRAGRPWPVNRWLCTAQLSRTLDPERTRPHRLADLCERYGVDPGRPHDALSDATATAAVLANVVRELGLSDLASLEPRLETVVPVPRARSRWPRRRGLRRRRPRPPATGQRS